MQLLKVFIVLIQTAILGFCQENWSWTSDETPKMESVLEGKDVVLKCGGRFKNASAIWEYKPCGDAYNMTLCSAAMSDQYHDWSIIKNENHEGNAMAGRLLLNNVTIHDQGLYRCRQQATPNIQVHSAVRLEVFSNKDDLKDHELPIFLDNLPRNLTIHKDSQAVFQCKVLSRTPPRILWVAAGAPGAGSVRYHQDWYSPMAAAAPVGLPGREYVSKMVMPRVKSSDAGRYYCVAINTKGFTNSSAYLEVLGGDWTLYLLFLIPVCLAAVPAILWGCFVWRRKKNEKHFNPADSPLRNSFEVEYL